MREVLRPTHLSPFCVFINGKRKLPRSVNSQKLHSEVTRETPNRFPNLPNQSEEKICFLFLRFTLNFGSNVSDVEPELHLVRSFSLDRKIVNESPLDGDIENHESSLFFASAL